MPKYSFSVNGVAQTVEAEPEMPLLWVLRDLLGLTGSKYGCGIGQCGACTIHLNGEPIRSCLLPVADASGQTLTTIEGLASRRSLHRVQDAWIEEDVAQCGYCQAGQIMNAASLLASNKNPTDSDIDSAMYGNICRCGTYQRIKKAIKSAAKQMNEEG